MAEWWNCKTAEWYNGEMAEWWNSGITEWYLKAGVCAAVQWFPWLIKDQGSTHQTPPNRLTSAVLGSGYIY